MTMKKYFFLLIPLLFFLACGVFELNLVLVLGNAVIIVYSVVAIHLVHSKSFNQKEAIIPLVQVPNAMMFESHFLRIKEIFNDYETPEDIKNAIDYMNLAIDRQINKGAGVITFNSVSLVIISNILNSDTLVGFEKIVPLVHTAYSYAALSIFLCLSLFLMLRASPFDSLKENQTIYEHEIADAQQRIQERTITIQLSVIFSAFSFLAFIASYLLMHDIELLFQDEYSIFMYMIVAVVILLKISHWVVKAIIAGKRREVRRPGNF